MLKGSISIGLAFFISFLLYKLKVIGDGDGRYLVSLSLCFPSYPGSIALAATRTLGFFPCVSMWTPLSTLVLTNTLFAIAFMLQIFKVLHASKYRLLYFIYTVTIFSLAFFIKPKLFFALPLPALLSSIREAISGINFDIPLIPCIFAGFIAALTVGDLSLWLCR